MSAVATWYAQFRARSTDLPGAHLPWLAATRRRAMERFAAEGWPTRRTEAWRHTSLEALAQQVFSEPGRAVLPKRMLPADDEPGHRLVFVDGRYAPALSRLGPLPAGARVGTLADALARGDQWIEPCFGEAADGESPVALNTALAGDGAAIHIARGVAISAPIHLVFVAASAGVANHVRNLIVAAEGTEATIIEHYLGKDGAASFTNTVTRIEAGADARITHLKLQQEGAAAFHLGALSVHQARGARFASHSLSFGARLARHDITTHFDGDGCEALLNGLYHVDADRHVDHHTRIEHAYPRGTSREFYRGLVDGSARGVFTGRILVAPGALGTDAQQRTDNLLLSRKAEADARPELEIYADDVRCVHGATVGQVDEEHLFYLRARGLDDAHARALLTYAFAAEALARVGPDALRHRAEDALRARLPGGDRLETWV